MAGNHWKDYWPEFSEALMERFESGHKTYGEKTFVAPLDKVLAEMEEEALDIIGWGFFAWRRLRELRKELEKVEARQ